MLALTSTRRFALGVLFLTGAVLTSGCSLSWRENTSPVQTSTLTPSPAPSTPRPPDTLPPPPAGLQRYYSQQVAWQPCEGSYQCATVEVPLDYAQPQGSTIRLAVKSRPATGAAPRLGALLFNPGGPGESGVRYLPDVLDYPVVKELSQQYDVVGFDPRGVGASAAVQCLQGAQLDQYLASDPTPDSEQEVSALQQANREFVAACQANTGALLGHISTLDTARDLDVVRAVMGDYQLNYLGFSYGTFLGAHYANLFPARVGRMVLDAALDPSVNSWETALGQARGFEQSLRAFITDCLSRGAQCPLRGSVDEAAQQIQRIIEQADAAPYPTGTQRQLTESLAVIGIARLLYSEQNWPGLRFALAQVLNNGHAALLLESADDYYSRSSSGFLTNSAVAFAAIGCADGQEPATPAQVRSRMAQFEQASPTFGRFVAWGALSCQQWPYPGAIKPGPLHAKGAAPILVIGTTSDPATPYAWAQGLAQQLDSGHLLTREGEGHTAIGSNGCIDQAVRAYFLQGTLPSVARC